VTEEAHWQEVVAKLVEQYGDCHGLINNAGVSHLQPVDQFTADDVEFLLRVNVEGMFLGLKHTMNVIAADAKHVSGVSLVVDGGPMAGEFIHHGVASQG